MMPSVYAEILEDMIERKIYSDVFQEMMVDYVVVCNRRFIFDVIDSASETNIENTETLEINKEDDESEETQHQNEESKMEYLKLLNELETIKITMKQKEKESTREIDKLKKEKASLLLELEHVKQDHSEYPRKNGVKMQNSLKALKIAN